eukprot:SAG22_NODE_9976_length_560_cov_1.106291_2_plen_106_part_00
MAQEQLVHVDDDVEMGELAEMAPVFAHVFVSYADMIEGQLVEWTAHAFEQAVWEPGRLTTTMSSGSSSGGGGGGGGSCGATAHLRAAGISGLALFVVVAGRRPSD